MTRKTVDPITVPFNILVPVGTTIAAPLVSLPQIPHGILEAIDLQIPPGHVGATGIRFTYSQQQVLPWSNTVAWINGDDLNETFPLDVEVNDQLRVITYNVGNYPHTFYLRFRVRQLDDEQTLTPLRLLPLSDIA